MRCQNQSLNLLQSKMHLLWCMCVLFYWSFVCIPAYANMYFKTTITKQNITIILIVGVPSSQALPGFLITTPPSMYAPEVIGVLAVWIPNQKKKTTRLVQWLSWIFVQERKGERRVGNLCNSCTVSTCDSNTTVEASEGGRGVDLPTEASPIASG